MIMSRHAIASVTKLRNAFIALEAPPIFLAPALHTTVSFTTPRSQFSTSASRCLRTRDNNKNRGVSALRRTGLKYPVSMSAEPLPQPVLDPKKRSKIKVDENHGLYGFFNKGRTALSTPEEDYAFGML